jgi:plastocyanin
MDESARTGLMRWAHSPAWPRAAVAIAFALGASGCGASLNHPRHEQRASTGPDGVQHVEITTHSFWFEPDRVVVTAGVPVEIRVRNGSLVVPHNFTCIAQAAEIGVKKDVGMLHGSGTVRFTPTHAGEYPFFCDKDAHAKKGMTGTLVVVER